MCCWIQNPANKIYRETEQLQLSSILHHGFVIDPENPLGKLWKLMIDDFGNKPIPESPADQNNLWVGL